MTAAERMRRLRERRRANGMKQVVRWVPSQQGTPSVYSSHRLLEARSLAMHAVIAQKITRDASLLKIPRNNLKRWRARWSESVPAWFEEWSQIMTRPWPEIAALITELSENAARLRQSSPFAGVLTPVERKRIYDAFRA
jgi:transposase-like protein